MPFTPADSRLFGPLFSEPSLAELFSDERFIQYLLEVEAALARVEGRLGVIPAAAAGQISAACQSAHIDLDRLSAQTEKDGFPITGLVEQLRAQVGAPAADFVHYGATTQDILDTALVLQLRAGLDLVEGRLSHLTRSLAGLADRHRHTLMAGRTHSQQALPITFGFKAAGWLAPLIRHRQRLAQIKPRLLVVQFGGAVGTLAALGEAGLGVQQALAAELGLGVLPMPWHSQRDNLAELAAWLALLSGSLAKLAQDIILLAQTEIGEVHEGGDEPRGRSSTMPQKANPVMSELVVAAARTNAALASSMFQALLQEQERGTGGWQMEWLALPQMFGLTAGALHQTLHLSEHLVVDEARMQANLRASHGLLLSEGISFLLSQSMERGRAKEIVRAAGQTATAEGRHLVDVVREMIGAAPDWPALRDEASYLGATQTFIDRVLEAAKAV
jgi:3-carboxy-cis,cis-muconate cycloisomerase